MAPTNHSNYEIGQVWSYKTRPNETSSLLYIVEIDDDDKLGKLYHISLDGLNLKNPQCDNGVQFDFPHAPVTIATLDTSVTELVKTTENLPDISEGYQLWRDAYKLGEGGVFDISVQQILEFVEEIILKGNDDGIVVK